MGNRKTTWLTLALIIAIVGFLTISFLSTIGGSKTETITIEQVNKPHNYKVQAPLKSDQHVHNLRIEVRGSISDTAIVGNVKLQPGKVDTVIYNHDWYAPDYELQYKPYKATEGNLKVELIFSYTD